MNIANDVCDYIYEENVKNTHTLTTLRDGLLRDEWDIITFQQASRLSTDVNSFFPYLAELCKYVRSLCPMASILIHQTWSYGTEEKLADFGFTCHEDMFYKVERTYKAAAEKISADGIIPAGETMERLKARSFSVHRDPAHASRGLGRYAIALTWFGKILGLDPREVKFSDFDEEITEEEITAAGECAYEALGSGRDYYYQDI